MSNTWAGMTFTNIAQLGITTLEKALVPLAGFTTDLSADIKDQGTIVNTRIVPAAAASQDLVDTLSGSYATAAQDTTTVSVPVTLDPHPVTGFYLTDTQAQEIGNGVWSDTAARLVKSAVRGIAEDVLDSVFALITNSNYSTAAFVGAASTFDDDDMVDLRQAAVEAGFTMADNPVCVLNPDYYGALLKDNAIRDTSSSGTSAPLTVGELPKLKNFAMIEAPTLPGNSENLVGFIAEPSAIAIAMRGVETQSPGDFLHFEILQGPVTGVVMTYSVMFNRTTRRIDHVFEALYGVAKAQAAALKRMTSA